MASRAYLCGVLCYNGWVGAECIAKYHFGGVVLFAENFRDAEQTLRLTADLQQTNLEAGGLLLFVAADQEGGYITRLTYGTRGPGNMALAAAGNPEYARSMASSYGKELSLAGVNTDFAPVMDINNNPNNPVIGVRSFGDSPEKVVKYGLPFMQGLHDQGTIVTLKHFPGHGNTDTDSHTGFPCIQSTYEELRDFELVPFQAAMEAGADMIMTAHIQYPQIETDTYTSISTGEEVYLPATMSDAILLTYGSYIMREVPPATGEGSAYMPNLPAGLCACFGMGEPGGQVPVALPEIDGNYQMIVNP